jgi:hypothetical protein
VARLPVCFFSHLAIPNRLGSPREGRDDLGIDRIDTGVSVTVFHALFRMKPFS